MEKINILFTLQSGRMGGAEHSLYYLIKNLDRERFKPRICFLEAGGELVDKLQALDVPQVILGLNLRIKKTRWRGITNPSALLYDGIILSAARRAFKNYSLKNRQQIDLIHTNSWLVNNVVLLSNPRMPVIWNVRDLSKPRLLKTLVRRAGKVVCVSKAVEELIYEEAFSERFTVVHNGIDLDEFRPDEKSREAGRRRLGLKEDQLAIGLFGRLTPLKGQAFFLKASADYLKERRDVKIVIVGETLFEKADYRPYLENLAIQSGLASQVIFMGRQGGIPALLNGIDIYVHPTTTKDAFPRATLEAMATATPTLAAGLGGIVEQIRNGEDGLLFTPNDKESLLESLNKLLIDKELRHNLGQKGRQRVEKDFNIIEKTKEMEKAYFEVLER